MLSTSRWTWPVSGVIAVVVAGTIVPPVSDRTTWTVLPVTLAPVFGWTMATVAGDDGRGPSDAGPLATAVVGAADRGPPEHATARVATARSAAASAARRRVRDIGDLMVAR